ncbi:MAG: SymE family type I addiction module toxin [Pseudomonadota bacterium]
MAKRTIAPEPRSAQEKSSYTRKLKVRKGSYDYQLNNIDNIHSYKAAPPVPWIHVKGYWLNKVGFTIGTAVCMEVSDGCLVIRAIPSTYNDQKKGAKGRADHVD